MNKSTSDNGVRWKREI